MHRTHRAPASVQYNEGNLYWLMGFKIQMQSLVDMQSLRTSMLSV